MAVMKEEIRSINKMGSSCIVSSEASIRVGLPSGTFARPPPRATRWVDLWVPRELKFKGWKRDSLQKKKKQSRKSRQSSKNEDLAKKPQAVKMLGSTGTKRKVTKDRGQEK